MILRGVIQGCPTFPGETFPWQRGVVTLYSVISGGTEWNLNNFAWEALSCSELGLYGAMLTVTCGVLGSPAAEYLSIPAVKLSVLCVPSARIHPHPIGAVERVTNFLWREYLP